jgi:hypothetical protein
VLFVPVFFVVVLSLFSRFKGKKRAPQPAITGEA